MLKRIGVFFNVKAAANTAMLIDEIAIASTWLGEAWQVELNSSSNAKTEYARYTAAMASTFNGTLRQDLPQLTQMGQQLLTAFTAHKKYALALLQNSAIKTHLPRWQELLLILQQTEDFTRLKQILQLCSTKLANITAVNKALELQDVSTRLLRLQGYVDTLHAWQAQQPFNLLTALPWLQDLNTNQQFIEQKLSLINQQIIVPHIESIIAGFLLNTLHRAWQLSLSCEGVHYFGLSHALHHSARRRQAIAGLLEKHIITPQQLPVLDDVVTLINEILDAHANNGRHGEGLHTNSFDTKLLQLLFNEGYPLGIFKQSLLNIQTLYYFPLPTVVSAQITPEQTLSCQKLNDEVLRTNPPSVLRGQITRWLQGPNGANPERLNPLLRQQLRMQAKYNLFMVQKIIKEFKTDNSLTPSTPRP